MKEIGGYFELDNYTGTIYHEDALALNCGRKALQFLLAQKRIKSILIPYFCCDCVSNVCKEKNVSIRYYHIDSDFRPIIDFEVQEKDWVYLVNFYGQLSNRDIHLYKNKYNNLILDNAHNYFDYPIESIDTIYTCRKYFGVSDGAFLYTNSFSLYGKLPIDKSYDRIKFVLGRYEENGSAFYKMASENNDIFDIECVKKMSKLTSNLLRGIDYNKIKNIREKNFQFLDSNLGQINKLKLTNHKGNFMYPLLLDNGNEIRKKLQQYNIYIPLLWPDVLKKCDLDSIEGNFSLNILPIPVDQRYNTNDMKYIVDKIKSYIKGEN